MRTIFVIADADDEIDIANSLNPMEDWDGVEVPGMSANKMAILHMLLNDETYLDASSMYVEVSGNLDGGPQLFPVPPSLVERLMEIEDDIDVIAEELISTEDFEQEEWTLEQGEALLSDLVASARICVSESKSLFMWMSDL